MHVARLGWLLGSGLVISAGLVVATRPAPGAERIVTGKFISPQGVQTEVGSFPLNMVRSSDGKFIVVTDVGARQQLSVLSAETGKVVSSKPFNGTAGRLREGLYYGLAVSGDRLYVSRGAMDMVSVFQLSPDGMLTEVTKLKLSAPKDNSGLPLHTAGVGVGDGGKTVFVVNNQSHASNDFTGSVSALDAATGEEKWRSRVAAFPMAIAVPTTGPFQGKVFVASERDGIVNVLDSATGKSVDAIQVGAQPAYVQLNREGTRLYVSNSGSDTISVIDLLSRKVVKTLLIRPKELGHLPGSTPLGLALSEDESRLYVAVADLNAVGVVDLQRSRVAGYIDAGWYPTAVQVSGDGKRLFIANARGTQVRNPNGKPVRNWGQYIEDILEGTVATVDLSQADNDLKQSTMRVLANNRAVGNSARVEQKRFGKPPIEHVVYIVKENRTYDQVLSDLPRGNSDRSLLLFGREVTPNQHALAERFVQLDNFYVCAEVSADGWPWSTQGAINAYTARNVTYNYSRRGRNYDFEGMNNGTAVDLEGKPDVARHEGGFIWEAMIKAKKSVRNYGFYTNFGSDDKGPDGKPLAEDNIVSNRVLTGKTSLDFRRYDMAYADSEAWVKYGLRPAPRQLAAFGEKKDPARLTTWLREFRDYESKGNFPQFSMVRLGRDHTSGTSAGQYSARACVADNDYAVGQIVEAISHSKYWAKTAIFVVEDDAQAGFDHVDAHRSTAYVISPLIKRGTLDSGFYNTVSVLRTMGLILGVTPHNQNVATANPLALFESSLVNPEPYNAILPTKEIIGEVNGVSAYRSVDSTRLIARMEEDSAPDFELNDILWGSIKGKATQRPLTPGVQWGHAVSRN